MVTPNKDLISPDIERFNKTQQRAFARGLWSAVLINRAVALWAYELEQYRRSRVTIIFNSASYLWLLARSVSLLALVNWGIYHADRGAFTHPAAPGFLTMLRYTIARLYAGQVSGIAPASTIAHIASFATLAVGVTILLGFLVSVGLSLRATHDESEVEGLVAGVRAESQRIDRDFSTAYGVSANEAIERLERLKEDTLGLLAGLAKRIPTDAGAAIPHEH
jgi:hypothetical protein